MNYVIELLEESLRNEKSWLCQHKKALKDGHGNISDSRAYKASIRLAQNRIPQLKTALKILKENEQH